MRTAEPVRATYAPAHPVDVRLVLAPLQRGGGDPSLRWDGSGVWRATRTPAGPATLHLVSGRDVRATAWGPGAEWAIEQMPELLGGRDDWSGLDVRAHPALAGARRRAPGLRLTRTARVLEALVPAVLEQKVTGMEAWRGWRRLLTRFGEPAPGPAPAGMRVAPSAETWRRIPSWEWHRAGVGPQRAETIVRCARVAESLERAAGAEREPAEAHAALTSIAGVGRWTAAETLARAHGDPDAVSVGDYNLPRLVGWALAGRPVDDDGMLELLEPWRGQRQRVVRLVELSGTAPARHGPRAPVRDHRAR